MASITDLCTTVYLSGWNSGMWRVGGEQLRPPQPSTVDLGAWAAPCGAVDLSGGEGGVLPHTVYGVYRINSRSPYAVEAPITQYGGPFKRLGTTMGAR